MTKKKPARFYYLDTVLKTPEILNTVNAESLKELKKAKRYFKYKNFFLYRLFRPVFFINRFSYYKLKRKPLKAIVRYFLYGF